jgi:acetyl esterase/lipase
MVEQLPQDVIARLRALDPAITPQLAQASWALLTPFHEKLGYTAPRIARDLAYGAHPRHRLDVHAGGEPSGDLVPVFMFVHGGGFVAGDKHRPGSPAYDLVGAWAVRHGWVGVNLTYRYAPEATWPAGAQDVAAVVGWVREHIAGYGGDPDRIVVAGSSAGAAPAAPLLRCGAGSGDGLPALPGRVARAAAVRRRGARPRPVPGSGRRGGGRLGRQARHHAGPGVGGRPQPHVSGPQPRR